VPNITTCDVGDSQINGCIKNIFNAILPQLNNGIPEFNVGSIDPIVYPKIPLNTSGTFDIIGVLEKVRFNGLSIAKVVAVRSDLSVSIFI
jgi:hypothetical protein